MFPILSGHNGSIEIITDNYTKNGKQLLSAYVACSNSHNSAVVTHYIAVGD